jgi:hypothetical protein
MLKVCLIDTDKDVLRTLKVCLIDSDKDVLRSRSSLGEE